MNPFRSLSRRYAALKVPGGEPPGPDAAEAEWPRATGPPGAARPRAASEKRSAVCFFFRSPRSGLPRKEVIQPHLPVRLPCYDFTPLAPLTFGASPPRGLGRRLRVKTTRVV